jgi:hypothetical protein
MRTSTLVSGLSGALFAVALISAPAQGAVGGAGSTNSTVTTSTSSSRTIIDTRVDINNYSTRVLGLATWSGYTDGGFTNRQVFDQTFALPTSSQEVVAAFGRARDEVTRELKSTGGRGEITYSESSDVQSSSSSSTVENNRNSTETVSFEESLGPGTIIIGDRDSGGTPFLVLAGTSNINVNTHTHTDIFTTTTVTTNTQTTWTVSGDLYSSPIILDLVGSGKIEASGGNWLPHKGKFYSKHRQMFDFFGNGFPVAMEWVGPNDGLLVRPKADGSVDGTCLFGSATGFNNGYEQLATLDDNMDGRLTGKELTGLSVWQDKNGNARCESGELRTVQQLGISEFSLRHKDYKSSFTMKGKTQAMFDWWPTMFELKKNKQPM